MQLWDNRAVSVESNTGNWLNANDDTDQWVGWHQDHPNPAQHVGPSLPNLDPQLTLWSQEPDPFRFLTDPTEYDAASRAGDEYEARTR